ncbi:MAG: 50S ribosomal protein L33 [Mycoplasmoidaceae bacterium]|nr:MAG: 50S ribosomal protein L33 [Mycoplasmoidaceae bacterium]
MKTKITLVCTECNSRNYHFEKNKYSDKRFELKKFCNKCNKATIHKETK